MLAVGTGWDDKVEFKIVVGETEDQTNARWTRRRNVIAKQVVTIFNTLQMFCVAWHLEQNRP